MKRKIQLINSLLQRDSWIYLAAICFMAIIFMSSQGGLFGSFLGLIILGIISFSPILLFTWFRSRIKNEFSVRRYWLLWVACFLILPAFVSIFHAVATVNILKLGPDFEIYFPITAVVFVSLETLLFLNKYFEHRIKRIQWIRKFDVDKLMLAATLFIGTIFGAVATSNLDHPPGERSLSDPIHLGEVANHPFSFISFSSQYIIAFGVLFLFYLINRHILIGKLLKERGFVIFLLGFIASISILFPVYGLILSNLPMAHEFVLLPSGNSNIMDEANFLTPAVFMLFTSPAIIVLEWFGQNNQINTLAKDRAEKELDFLKQQINPHFFFNTLNNLYALSLQKSEQTPEVIMQLSDLMRYVIYKGKEDYVTIGEEMEYLEDYVQLQRLRYHNALDFKLVNDIEDIDIPIPPLLLIVLVENAFKHGVESAEHHCFVHIRISNQDDDIYFEIVNSVENQEVSSPGIGINNLRRRLDLLYPEMYDLQFHSDYSIFKANLNLYAA